MKKGRYIISLILNVLIIAATAFAITNTFWQYLGMDADNQAVAALIAGDNVFNYFFEFGFLAALFGAIVALIAVISDIVCLAKEKPTSKFVAILKMLSAGVALTAILNYFVLDGFCYQFVDGFASADQCKMALEFLLDWHGPLFISIVAPAIVILDYIFFELEPKVKFAHVLWGFLPGIAYFGFITLYDYLVVAKGNGDFPAIFVFNAFRFSTFENWYRTAIIIGGGILGIFLLTMLLFGIRNLVSKACLQDAPAALEEVATEEEKPVTANEENKNEPITESDVQEKAAPVEEKNVAQVSAEPAKKPAPKKTSKKVIILKTEEDKARDEGIDIRQDNGDEEAEEAAERKAEAKSTYKSAPRVYHISKQPSGKWQVKLATGERAIKLFDTQQQAIVYAKSLVRTQGGSIRIHAVSGKMRKE